MSEKKKKRKKSDMIDRLECFLQINRAYAVPGPLNLSKQIPQSILAYSRTLLYNKITSIICITPNNYYRISSPISLVIFSVSDTEIWETFYEKHGSSYITKGLGFKNNS